MAAPLRIVDGLWQIGLGAVNAFVLADGAELMLVDTGLAGSERQIAQAVESIGRPLTDIRHIVVTHCHPDHAGGAAALKRITGAPVYMHPIDAALVREGRAKRPLTPAPGLLRHVLFNVFVSRSPGIVDPCPTDRELLEGTELPFAGGIRVLHMPGHCAGQVALLWAPKRVLFAADIASNVFGLGLSLGYEDLQIGLQSLARVSSLDFDAVCFGHGTPILQNGAARFRERWGAAVAVAYADK